MKKANQKIREKSLISLTLLSFCYVRPIRHWTLDFMCLAELLCSFIGIYVYIWQSFYFTKYCWHLGFGTSKYKP